MYCWPSVGAHITPLQQFCLRPDVPQLQQIRSVAAHFEGRYDLARSSLHPQINFTGVFGPDRRRRSRSPCRNMSRDRQSVPS